jgi:hypothetical protein
MAIRHKPKWFKPVVITLAQISQMVVGIAVTAVSFYYYKQDPDCYVRIENIGSALIMYGSYLLLFVEFFLRRYYGKPTESHLLKRKRRHDGNLKISFVENYSCRLPLSCFAICRHT